MNGIKKLLKLDKIVNQEKYLAEILYNQKLDTYLQHTSWIENKKITGGSWSVGSPFLYLLIRILSQGRFINILEFGLGETSKICSQVARVRPEDKIKVIEDSTQWFEFFKPELHFTDQLEVIITERVKQDVYGQQVNMFANLWHLLGKDQYGLIIVDGPRGSEHYSRYQIVQLVERDLLGEDFIILIDDAQRTGEKETIELLLKLLDAQGRTYKTTVYSGLKDMFVICSDANFYFTSLH